MPPGSKRMCVRKISRQRKLRSLRRTPRWMMRSCNSLIRLSPHLYQVESVESLPMLGSASRSDNRLWRWLRNIGDAVGIAALSTLISVRERFHSLRIGESESIYSPAAQERLAQATGYFAGQGGDPQAAMRAVGALGGIVRSQASVMSWVTHKGSFSSESDGNESPLGFRHTSSSLKR